MQQTHTDCFERETDAANIQQTSAAKEQTRRHDPKDGRACAVWGNSELISAHQSRSHRHASAEWHRLPQG